MAGEKKNQLNSALNLLWIKLTVNKVNSCLLLVYFRWCLSAGHPYSGPQRIGPQHTGPPAHRAPAHRAQAHWAPAHRAPAHRAPAHRRWQLSSPKLSCFCRKPCSPGKEIALMCSRQNSASVRQGPPDVGEVILILSVYWLFLLLSEMIMASYIFIRFPWICSFVKIAKNIMWNSSF